MNIHPNSTASKSEIKRVATLVGLSEIDFDSKYTLVKTGAKVKSSMGYPDEMLAIDKAEFMVVGGKDLLSDSTLVWIVGMNMTGKWFKTSPILSCEKIKKGFKI